jgi:hypothetical protein
MKESDFKELKRILDLMPGMPLISFADTDGGWYMDDDCVYWTHEGEEYSEEIYEPHNTVGDFLIVNLRLCTGCTETSIFSMSQKLN